MVFWIVFFLRRILLIDFINFFFLVGFCWLLTYLDLRVVDEAKLLVIICSSFHRRIHSLLVINNGQLTSIKILLFPRSTFCADAIHFWQIYILLFNEFQ